LATESSPAALLVVFLLFAKNNIMNNAFRYVHKQEETTEEATIRNDNNSLGRMK